jgi:hypothetical protein
MLDDLRAEFDHAYSSGTDEQKRSAFPLVLKYNDLKDAVDDDDTDNMRKILDFSLTKDIIKQAFERQYGEYQQDVNQYVEKAEECFKATKVYDAGADDTLLRATLDAKVAFERILLTATAKMEKLQNAQNAADVEAVDAHLLAEQDATETVKKLSVQVKNQENDAYASHKNDTRHLYGDMIAIDDNMYARDFWASERKSDLQRRASSVLARRRSVVNLDSIPLKRAQVLVECAQDAAAIKAEVDVAIEEEKKKKHAPGSLASLKAKIGELFNAGRKDLAVSATVMYVYFEGNGEHDVSAYIKLITDAESDGRTSALIEQGRDRLTTTQSEIVRDGKAYLEALKIELSGITPGSLPQDIAKQLADALDTVEAHSELVAYCYSSVKVTDFDDVYSTIKTYRQQAQEAAITAQQLRVEAEQARAAAPVAHAHAKAIRFARKSTASDDEIALLEKLPFPCTTWLVNAGEARAGNVFALFADHASGSDGNTVANVQSAVQRITNSDNFKSSGKNPTRLVVINAVGSGIDEVPTEVKVMYGSSEVTLKTHRTQRNVALVYAPGYDVLVDEDGEFFSCTLIPAQPIVADSKEITREDYCAGTLGRRLRAESMYVCHRKVLAFALDERQKQAQRMSSGISGHEIVGDFDRVFVTSDIHADLRKFVQILLACELISIETYTHDDIYANDTNIYEIVWKAKWVAQRTLLVICGDIIDGKRMDTNRNFDGTGDVHGSYEFLLHCLLFNLRIQARTLGSDVRFTIGNHDAATVTSYPPYRFMVTQMIPKDAYVEEAHFKFAQCASSRHMRLAGDDEFDPLYRGRQQMLLPFYACSPYLVLTMREIAFAHAGFVGDYGQDVFDASVEKQDSLDARALDVENVSGFLAPAEGEPGVHAVISNRAYAEKNPCGATYGHNKFKLIAVGHCVTHQYSNLSPLMKEQCDHDTLGTHGCVLTRDCTTAGGPLIALVDTGMSAAMRIRGAGEDQDITTQNKSRQVGMLVIDKEKRSGESLGIVNVYYNVYRIRAMREMRFLLKNGREPSMLVIGGSTVPLTYTEEGAMDTTHQTCLENWAAEWNKNPRIARFTPARGKRSGTGKDYPIVEIHNKANGNCLLEALGFYLCVSGKWDGTVTGLRTKLLLAVENRLLGSSPDKNDRLAALDTKFTEGEDDKWMQYKASVAAAPQQIAAQPNASKSPKKAKNKKYLKQTKQAPAADPDEAFNKYVFIRKQDLAYLGNLEIDAFARVFKCTVYVWYINDRGKLDLYHSTPARDSPANTAQIENFGSVVHLYYYVDASHFTLLALQVPTQERASSFGRKRAKMYV